MRGGWFLLLGGLIVWAAHFLALYVIGEVRGGDGPARAMILVLTGLALAADGALAWHIRGRSADTGFERWRRSVVLAGAALSAIAVIWQMLPALFQDLA